MNKADRFIKQIRLEQRLDLPSVLTMGIGLELVEASPNLWNKGVTLAEAAEINQNMVQLCELLR